MIVDPGAANGAAPSPVSWPRWRRGNLRGQRNLFDGVPQWRDKDVRGQWNLLA